MQASRYSRSHHSELDIDGVELLPSDNESPNMNLNYSASPIIYREQLPPPSHAQDLRSSAELQHNQHTETPSVHASGLSPEYAAYPPHSSPINYEVSQGTAGFGEPQSFQSTDPERIKRYAIPEAQLQTYPQSAGQQILRQSAGAGLPPRVISPPLSITGRLSSGAMSGDSLAHYSLVNQSRTGYRSSVQTPPGEGLLRAQSPTALVKNLAQKVRVQAERLHSLDQYKLLCERRIAELSTGHPLPVQIQHLGTGLEKEAQISELIDQVQKQDQEIQVLHNKLEQQTREKMRLKEEQDKIDTLEVNLRGVNQRKLNSMLRESKEVKDALRGETLANQELKRYVEILKEALATKIEKEGFIEILRGQRKSRKQKTQLSDQEIDIYVDLSRLTNENQELKREQEGLVEKREQLQQELDILHLDLDALKTDNIQMRQQLESLKEGIQRLEQEKTTLLEFADQSMKRREEEEKLIRELREAKSETQKELDIKIEALQMEIKKVKKVQSAMQEIEEKKEKIEATKEKAEKELRQLQVKSELLEEKEEKREKEVQSLKKERDELSGQLARTKSQLEVKESELFKEKESARLNHELLNRKLMKQEEKVIETERLQHQFDIFTQEQVGGLQERLKAAEEKYQAAKKCLYRTEKECFDRKDEVEKMQTERAHLMQAKTRLEGTLGQVQAELNIVRDRAQMVEQVERKYERAENLLKDLEREKFTLQQRISQLEDSLNKTKSELKKAKTEGEVREQQLMQTQRSQEQEIKQVERTIQEKNKHSDELLVLLGNLRHQVTQKDANIVKLQSQVRIYKQELEHLHLAKLRRDQESRISPERDTLPDANIEQLNSQLHTLRQEAQERRSESERLGRENETLRQKMKVLEQEIAGKMTERNREYVKKIEKMSPLRNKRSQPESVVTNSTPPPVTSSIVLSGLNVTLEAIRGFIERSGSTLLQMSGLSESYKNLVSRMKERLKLRIFSEDEKEEAIYRIDEWVRGTMQELERAIALLPSRESSREYQEEDSVVMNRTVDSGKPELSQFRAYHYRKPSLPKHRTNRSLLSMPEGPSAEELEALEKRIEAQKRAKEELITLTYKIIAALPSEELKRISKDMMESYERLSRLRGDKEGLDLKLLTSQSLYKMHVRERKGEREATALKQKLERAQSSLKRQKDEIEFEERKFKLLNDELTSLIHKQQREITLEERHQKQMNNLMQETQDMRSQLASIVNSRDNTEQLNQKLTEERRFLDKELINLRAQLALSHQPHLLQAQEPLYLTSLPPSFGGTTRFQNKADISDFQLKMPPPYHDSQNSQAQKVSLPGTARSYDVFIHEPPTAPMPNILQQSAEDSQSKMSQVAPMPQTYRSQENYWTSEVVEVDGSRALTEIQKEESEITPPRNTLQDRLAKMQQAIKERLGSNAPSINSSFQ